jgi:hypothetical protein
MEDSLRRTGQTIRMLIAGAFLAGCGGRQVLGQPDDAPVGATPAAASVGAVDLSQAPAELEASCDQGVGTIAFRNPCLVSQSLGGDPAELGIHEVECSLATPDHPMTWSFLFSLAEVAANPDRPVDLPGAYATTSPTSGAPVDVGGRRAGVSGVAGTLTFSRVDPTNRAFVARFQGTMTWKDAAGTTFSCAVDAPLWGAPGSFL